MGAIERRGKDRRAGHVRVRRERTATRALSLARLDDDVQRRRQARPIVRQSRAMDERRREHATDVRSVVRRHRALGELSAVESSARFHDVVTRAGDRDGVAVLFAQSDQDVVWEERGGHQRSDFEVKNAPHAPVAVSLGDEGSMIYMLPHTDTVVVTLGRTTAGSPACPAAPSDVVAKAEAVDETTRISCARCGAPWAEALKPMELEKPTKSTQRKAALEHDWRRWEERKSKAKTSSSSSNKLKSKSRRSDDVANQGLSESSGILDAVRRSHHASHGRLHEG